MDKMLGFLLPLVFLADEAFARGGGGKGNAKIVSGILVIGVLVVAWLILKDCILRITKNKVNINDVVGILVSLLIVASIILGIFQISEYIFR